MNYLSLLSLAIFLIAATSADETSNFTSVRVNLAFPKMQQISNEFLTRIIESFRDAVTQFGVLETKGKIGFLKSSVVTDNFKTVDKKNGTNQIIEEKYKNGSFNGTYEDLLEIKATFHNKVTVEGFNADDGEGDFTVKLKKIKLSQRYDIHPSMSEINIEHEITSFNYNGGFLREFVADMIKKQIELKINNLLDTYIISLKAEDLLKEIETPMQILEKNKTYISTERLTVNMSNGGESQQRFVGANLSYSENESKKVEKLEKGCNFERLPNANHTEICFCPYMFLQMLVFINKESPIELGNWNLKGKVIELYEVLPNLINHHSPDKTYTVNVKDVNFSTSDSQVVSVLQREYKFMIEEEILLKLTTLFNLTLVGYPKDQAFFVNYTSVTIKNIKTDILVQPSGRTVLARFMLSEARRLEGHHMFDEGMTLPKRSSNVSVVVEKYKQRIPVGKETFCVNI